MMDDAAKAAALLVCIILGLHIIYTLHEQKEGLDGLSIQFQTTNRAP